VQPGQYEEPGRRCEQGRREPGPDCEAVRSASRTAHALRRRCEGSANSAAVAKRSAGVLASARTIASSIAGGTAARIALTPGGAAARCWRTMLSALGPVKGGSPANISYSTHPRL